MINIKSLLLHLLEVLWALSVAAAFEATTFCPDLWPSSTAKPNQNPESPRKVRTSRCGDESQPKTSSSPANGKSPPAMIVQEDQSTRKDESTRKGRLAKKGKARKKSQLSTKAQPVIDPKLESALAPVPGPVTQKLAVSNIRPFTGSTMKEPPVRARRYACAPAYNEGCMIIYTDGSFLEGKTMGRRQAGAAVVFKTSPTEQTWHVRAFHMFYDYCYWCCKDIEIWAMAAALETVLDVVESHTRAASGNSNSILPLSNPIPVAPKQIREVKIFTDCLTGLDAIAKTKFARNISVDACPGLEKFLHHAGQLDDLGVHISIHWCPGHDGIPGNEEADKMCGIASRHKPGFAVPFMPKPSGSSARHPLVWELDVQSSVSDRSKPPRPGLRPPSNRPRKNGKSRQMIPLEPGHNLDPAHSSLISQSGLTVIASAIDKLAQNQSLLVQALSQKVQYGAPSIATISASATQTTSPGTAKPITLTEAPPEPSRKPNSTVDIIMRLHPARRLVMGRNLESRTGILGLAKSLMPMALPEPDLIGFSSSGEEVLDRFRSPLSHGYDSEQDSVISLDTAVTSVEEGGGAEAGDDVQNVSDAEHPGPNVAVDRDTQAAGINVEVSVVENETGEVSVGGQHVADVEHPDLGPDFPVNHGALAASDYLKRRFPYIK